MTMSSLSEIDDVLGLIATRQWPDRSSRIINAVYEAKFGTA